MKSSIKWSRLQFYGMKIFGDNQAPLQRNGMAPFQKLQKKIKKCFLSLLIVLKCLKTF